MDSDGKLAGSALSVSPVIRFRLEVPLIVSVPHLIPSSPDAAANTTLLPCRHTCVCSGCLQQMDKRLCPLCRAPFEWFLSWAARGPPEPRIVPAIETPA